ncbi:MAG: hypothetical protein LBQ40_04520 [Clostridiales bacterium]|jgi:hypothetical protein|nr:hypothetical protein [Clostridiales bacterium]
MGEIENQLIANKCAEINGLNLQKDALEQLNVTVGFELVADTPDIILHEDIFNSSRLMRQAAADSGQNYVYFLRIFDEQNKQLAVYTNVIFTGVGLYGVTTTANSIKYTYAPNAALQSGEPQSVTLSKFDLNAYDPVVNIFEVVNLQKYPNTIAEIKNGSFTIYF